MKLRIIAFLAVLALLGSLTSCAFASKTEMSPPVQEHIPPSTEDAGAESPDDAVPPPADEDAVISEARFEKKRYARDGTTLNYWLYTPANATENMPLVLYLHGGSGKGSDLEAITAVDGFPQYLRDARVALNAYVLIPQMPAACKGWAEMKSGVMKLLSFVRNEYGIDAERISLTGHSMGGTGAWALALAYPNTFYAVAPLSGSVSLTAMNLEKLRGMAVWAIVGAEDTVVDPQASIDFITALCATNANAKLSVLSGADHFAVPGRVFLADEIDLIAWLVTSAK